MKKLVLIIIVALVTINCFGQSPNFAWAQSAIGVNSDMGNSTAVDKNGNVYITGCFLSPTITFGSITLTRVGSTYNLYVVKYDNNGNVLWANSAGGNGDDRGMAIAVDTSGNVYITGYFSSSYINFGSIHLNCPSLSYNTFVAKYDTNGNILWAKSSLSVCDGGFGIAVDGNGNCFVTGFFLDYTISFGSLTLTGGDQSYECVYIVKLDTNGNAIWGKTAGAYNGADGYGIAVDRNGSSYIIGTFSCPTITFGSITLTNANATATTDDVFIVKFDSSGTAVWAHRAGTSSYDEGFNIAVDSAGNSYVTGNFGGTTITFGSTTLSAVGVNNAFLAKYDANGNSIWAKRIGAGVHNEGKSLGVDRNGNSYIIGSYSDSLTIGSFNFSNATNGDIFIAKFDTNGNDIWATSAGGNDSDYGSGIAVDENGNCYATGFFDSQTISFGNTSLVNSTGAFTSHDDVFITKLYIPQKVWPGDVDNNQSVDNNDLLPIGLYYGLTGIPRDSISNLWQADSSANWGIIQSNNFDVKYVDCNGDGTIDANDTLAVNLNFSLVHAIHTMHTTAQRTSQPDIYFVTNSNHYNAGDMVDVEVWAGSASTPINNLYGIAFNINYDASLIQSGTENITYPPSWLGTAGTDAIKISKIDAIASTAYGATTRINHTNASGYGKIADFNFQVNTSLTNPFTMHLSISNYMANDSAGAPKTFNLITDSVLINASTVAIKQQTDNTRINIYPNPFTSQTTIVFSEEQKNTTIYITDVVGKEIKSINFSGKQCTIEKGTMKAGVYFVRIEDEKKNVMNRKVMVE